MATGSAIALPCIASATMNNASTTPPRLVMTLLTSMCNNISFHVWVQPLMTNSSIFNISLSYGMHLHYQRKTQVAMTTYMLKVKLTFGVIFFLKSDRISCFSPQT
ncbi:MAG: hypothetical protein V7K48_22985 [Nostoc sp.]|uniref:hypothetical protein n=1 Tax=Nostoc sp. TaxID=1180 RepID=UPI002FFB4F08